MAPPKKKIEEVKSEMDTNIPGVMPEEPVIIAGDPEHTKAAEPVKAPKAPPKPTTIQISSIPMKDLKELLALVDESYSRSNNRDFRLKCKRLSASVGGWAASLEDNG